MTPFPPEALAQHVAIVGATGSGKTFTSKGAVEALLRAGKRVCVIDPTGAWWGLRLKADGSSSGFPVAIFGGEHADVPLSAKMGGRIAELVGTRNLPAVLDLSEMLIGDQHEFMTDFAEALFQVNRTPLHLIIDEADQFVPQNPLPETRRMLHHIDRIVRRGRIKGFRVTMITQRPATIHKNVLTQANTLVAMRLPSPQDRKAIEEWVKGNADAGQAKDVLNNLARLERGTGYLWCPSLDILKKTRFPAIETFDSGRTPEDGDDAPEPVHLAPMDLAELRAFAEAMESEGEDSETARPRGKASKEALAEAEKRGFDRGWAEARREFNAAFARLSGNVRAFCADLESQIRAATDAEPEVLSMPDPAIDLEVRLPTSRPAPKAPRPSAKAGEIGSLAQRLLDEAQKRFPAVFTWGQLAALCQRKARGGSFNTARKELIEGGHVSESGQLVVPAVAEKRARPSPSELIEIWKSVLPAPADELFAVLASRKSPITAEELAHKTNRAPRGGSWNTAMSVLKTNGLIKEVGRGEFVLGSLAQ